MYTEKFRSYFPYLKTGQIYFAHASLGPLSTLVVDAVKDYMYVRSETKIDDYKTYLKILASVKASLGGMLNTTSDRIAILDNTTNGINVIANSIIWNKGDRIVLNDLEFPANVYPFLNLKRFDVEVDFVKSHDGIVSAEDLINAVKPGTKLISVSQVQFLTGYRIDLDKLGSFCKENNIILSVDAIQGLGALKLDAVKSKVDFLSCGTEKWMLGLQGLAYIYVSESLQQIIEPGQIGWVSVKDAWNLLSYDLNLKDSADRFETGTLNTAGVYALDASMKLFNEAGFDEIEKQVIDNSEYFIKQLQTIGIVPYLADEGREYLSGIVSFKHAKAGTIFDSLLRKNIVTSLREGIIRFAPHFYNTTDDIDKVIDVLKGIKVI